MRAAAPMPAHDRRSPLRLQDATPGQRKTALRLSIAVVLGTLILLPFAKYPWPNVPGFLSTYQTAAIGTCLITAYLMYGHFRATGSTPLLHLSAGYGYTAGVLIMQMLSFKGVFVEGDRLFGGSQTTPWLWLLLHLGPAVSVLVFALSQGRGRSAGNEVTPYAVPVTAVALFGALGATALLTFVLEGRLPVLDVDGDFSPMTSSGLAPALQLLIVAALVVLWRASRFHNVLHVWLGVAMVAFLCDNAIMIAAGHQLTAGWYLGRLVALIGLSVVAVIYLRAIHLSHRLNLALADELASTNSVLDEDIRERTSYALQLEEAGQRKDEFLVMLAHELRNPLAPIRAASDLLATGYKDEVLVRKVSRMLNRQVMQMSRLVDDLMDMSRVARGRLVLQKTVVNMQQVIEDSMEQITPLVAERRLERHRRICEEPALVAGDPGRLVQVMANLLNNAAKYTNPGGAITLALEVRQISGEVLVTVSDTGIGMTPELVDKAFLLFSQGEVTPDRARGGLGIGLALVKSVVELHQGSVSASSPGLGLGSEFTVVLPLSGETANPA